MAYLFLGLAIVAEVVGTSALKSTEGFSRPFPTIGCLAAYAASFYLLSRSLEAGMSVGVGYALWSALGTTLIVVVATAFLDEPISLAKVVGVALVIVGVVVLNLDQAH